MELSQSQRAILLHMTGLGRSPLVTRNHFATDEQGKDYDTLQELVGLGLAWRREKPVEMWGGMYCYHCTDAGLAAASATARGE